MNFLMIYIIKEKLNKKKSKNEFEYIQILRKNYHSSRSVKNGGRVLHHEFQTPKNRWKHGETVGHVFSNETLGRLSNNNDDGSENITKKMSLLPFKLYRVYLEPLNSSNVGNFSWRWIFTEFIHVQIEKGKFFVVLSTSSIKRRFGRFYVVHAVNVKEMYQKPWFMCKAVLLIKPIVYWRCCCRRRHSCLRSLIRNFPLCTTSFQGSISCFERERENPGNEVGYCIVSMSWVNQ